MLGNAKDIIKWLLNKDNELFEIKEVKDTKTNQQNRYLWKLISEITKALHDNDDMNTYITLLERANVKYDYVMGLPEIEDKLKQSFRAVKITRYEEYKGKKLAVYKCYLGVSKFEKKEMMELIDRTLDLAVECGIDIKNYERVLK